MMLLMIGLMLLLLFLEPHLNLSSIQVLIISPSASLPLEFLHASLPGSLPPSLKCAAELKDSPKSKESSKDSYSFQLSFSSPESTL